MSSVHLHKEMDPPASKPLLRSQDIATKWDDLKTEFLNTSPTLELKELLRPHLLYLYEHTTIPKVMAVDLYSRYHINDHQKDQLDRLDNFERNEMIYNICMQKGLREPLFEALKAGGNKHIIEFLLDKWTTNPPQVPQKPMEELGERSNCDDESIRVYSMGLELEQNRFRMNIFGSRICISIVILIAFSMGVILLVIFLSPTSTSSSKEMENKYSTTTETENKSQVAIIEQHDKTISESSSDSVHEQTTIRHLKISTVEDFKKLNENLYDIVTVHLTPEQLTRAHTFIFHKSQFVLIVAQSARVLNVTGAMTTPLLEFIFTKMPRIHTLWVDSSKMCGGSREGFEGTADGNRPVLKRNITVAIKNLYVQNCFACPSFEWILKLKFPLLKKFVLNNCYHHMTEYLLFFQFLNHVDCSETSVQFCKNEFCADCIYKQILGDATNCRFSNECSYDASDDLNLDQTNKNV